MSDEGYRWLIIADNCLNVLTKFVPKIERFSAETYSSSAAMSKAVSTSITEPLAISKNRFRSASDLLEQPSAIFKCTERAALRIC